MKVAHASGKRKKAVARATLREGKGKVRINKIPLDLYEPKLVRLKLREPLILAGDVVNKLDIEVNVMGGGINSQAEASRLAIAKVLVDYAKGASKDLPLFKRRTGTTALDTRRPWRSSRWGRPRTDRSAGRAPRAA